MKQLLLWVAFLSAALIADTRPAQAQLPILGSELQPIESHALQETTYGGATNRTDLLEPAAFRSGASDAFGWSGAGVAESAALTGPGLFAGVEGLLVRPHFSEAIAFARGLQTPTSFETTGRELHFDYEASIRATAGYRFDQHPGQLAFTFWHFRGDTSAGGTVNGPGQFLVDPFGNIVGNVTVIDPASAQFGTLLTGGDRINTKAIVETNVYDLEYSKTLCPSDCDWLVRWSAGVRIADIDQFYESVITQTGTFFSGGDFSADFDGAGPRVGLECVRFLGWDQRWSLFGRTNLSLLVGEYTVQSSRTTTQPFGFRAAQSENLTRTIPVVEAELGATCRIGESFDISASWLFQGWYDLGTSGGQFGGFFAGADDTNLMSFDGFALRAQLTY